MKKEKYIRDVLRLLNTNKKTKNRIKEDLAQRIEQAQDEDVFFDVINDIGKPEDVAKELMENLNIEGVHRVREPYQLEPYEYKSKKTIFGLPLIHIHTGGRYQTKVARGIIAIGDVAQGVVALGGVAVGLVSVGGIGIGIVSLGGVAIGGIALGGVAIGAIALGGVAIGLFESIGAVVKLLL